MAKRNSLQLSTRKVGATLDTTVRTGFSFLSELEFSIWGSESGESPFTHYVDVHLSCTPALCRLAESSVTSSQGTVALATDPAKPRPHGSYLPHRGSRYSIAQSTASRLVAAADKLDRHVRIGVDDWFGQERVVRFIFFIV